MKKYYLDTDKYWAEWIIINYKRIDQRMKANYDDNDNDNNNDDNNNNNNNNN